MQWFACVCTGDLSTMKFHMLNHLLEDVRNFSHISVLDVSGYDQFSVHIKRSCEGSSRRRTRSMQETVILLKRQRTDRNIKCLHK